LSPHRGDEVHTGDLESDPAYAPTTARLGALGVFANMAVLRACFRELVEGALPRGPFPLPPRP
jgi:hypothetical protein